MDAEGKAVAGEVPFLSVWPGKGAENIIVEVVVGGASGLSRAPSCGGGGRGGRLEGRLRVLNGTLWKAVQGPGGVGDAGGTMRGRRVLQSKEYKLS
jgi:hypothetical protein